MVSADFSVSSRVSDNFNTVTFTDASAGAITSRMWILGDGTVIEGNDTVVKHTYTVPGKYSVTLVVQDATDQASKTKPDYVIVNDLLPAPAFIIMQTSESNGNYWKFYVDSFFYLVFETPVWVYRSIDKALDVKRWSLVQFDFVSEKMYMGTFSQFYKEIPCSRSPNYSPLMVSVRKTEVASQSTIKLDDLKVWGYEKSLKDYYSTYRSRAGQLDSI